MREEDVRDFSAFLREFQAETDRGAALVGTALLDERLAATLRAFMVPGRSAQGLVDAGGSAPLGTLSARIKACHALALIDDHEAGECNLIRRVRNEFAHRAHGTTFTDARIAGLCYRLQSDLPGGRAAFQGNPRGVFVNAVVLTVMRLTYRAEWVAKERRRPKNWP